ncbi:vacuolar protein sorting-associated protein 9A [Dendrobium catenatum]|uniref:vacuolar protein sorting-associated protein 9A n=1 Tax=Dendrobium catenatum TaxID=906689 RepID=UPI0009F2B7E9|nr:vacuolar protein sorting-associated protein 9A [Dendrobium catenatum]
MDGGGASDAFSASTAPLAWHDFLERMRHPSAADFVKSIKSFIVSFSNRAPDPEKDHADVQLFLANMEDAFRAHMLWAGSSEEELESAGEGLEKYVMTKLFNRAFASLPEDVQHDEELFEKTALLQQFVRPENLDIKPEFQNETSWLLAQKELQKINMYKAPRDKLVCILNCCRVINNLLLNVSIASNANPPGADEFLPVLIYVTIKANPPQLHSNLVYIQRYRRKTRLVAEAAYFFTNILSAESFVWNLNGESLSMEETEFQKKMESARAQLLGLSTETIHHRNKTTENVTERITDGSKSQGEAVYASKENRDLSRAQLIASRPSISDLEKKGVAELLKDGELTENCKEYPYLYANAGDLTVDDVESLLSCYKKLVLKYVCLSKGMGISAPYIGEPNSQLDEKLENPSGLFEVSKGKVSNGKYSGSRTTNDTSTITSDDVSLKLTPHDTDSQKEDAATEEINNIKDLRSGTVDENSEDNTTMAVDDVEPKVDDPVAHTSTK